MKKSEAIAKKIAERENMMQMFYQMKLQEDYSIEAFNSFIQKQMTGTDATGYSKELYEAFSSHREEIDRIINENSIKWKTERMPAVDLSILRLSLTEIKYIDTIPPSVSINEAVNLAKKFSTEKSASFINGILGNIVNK
jgi:N utilization substance protein B